MRNKHLSNMVREFLQCEALCGSHSPTFPQSNLCVAMLSTMINYSLLVHTSLESLRSKYEIFYLKFPNWSTVCLPKIKSEFSDNLWALRFPAFQIIENMLAWNHDSRESYSATDERNLIRQTDFESCSDISFFNSEKSILDVTLHIFTTLSSGFVGSRYDVCAESE